MKVIFFGYKVLEVELDNRANICFTFFSFIHQGAIRENLTQLSKKKMILNLFVGRKVFQIFLRNLLQDRDFLASRTFQILQSLILEPKLEIKVIFALP